MTYTTMHLPKTTSQKELNPSTDVQTEFAGKEKKELFQQCQNGFVSCLLNADLLRLLH